MIADPYIYRRAAHPHGLRCAHTVNTAINETTAAALDRGVPAKTCPAVRLLLRHADRINRSADIDADYPEDNALRLECLTIAASLEQAPTLAILFSDLNPTPKARNLYIRKIKTQLSGLASALQIPVTATSIEVTHHSGAFPTITFRSPALYIQIARGFIPGHDIKYRTSEPPGPTSTNPTFHAPISALDEPKTMARLIHSQTGSSHEIA